MYSCDCGSQVALSTFVAQINEKKHENRNNRVVERSLKIKHLLVRSSKLMMGAIIYLFLINYN